MSACRLIRLKSKDLFTSSPTPPALLASREIPGLLRSGNTFPQDDNGILSRGMVLSLAFWGLRQIERHQEMLRPTQRKGHVTAAAFM